MNQERLNKVRELFDEASNLSVAERELYLNQKCANDLELKKEILSLFNSLGSTKDFLEEPLTIVEQNKSSFTDPYIGKQIGNYLIEGEAGVGGMGIVYTGKRNDKEFEQKVAIKILKHGITSEYLLKRFQIERQTLANLQHQNIARLLDGGRTVDGLPYLVMEFIDGIPITECCNQKKLNIEEKLRLFREVCNAVQYAHQNLIIHRDLKPGNILVTNDGIPKLLDFGIAKLIDEDLVDETEGLTRTGVWHLTPEYASPEQIKGEKITTTSDVYSLGVLLYHILTGTQPYKITNSSPAAISKIITEEKILKPSERITQSSEISSNNQIINQKKLSAHLKGDLDNIILKAMHKDPLRRYVSVEQFSDDIRRHLEGLPVFARADTITYRFSKFIRRHKVGFALFLVGNLLVFISIAAIIYQGNVAAKERDKANIELKKFEEVNNFLLEMLSSADPGVEGKDIKVYDLLDKATEDVNVKLKNHPEIKSAIKQTLGSTYIGLGDYEKAKLLLTESLEANKKLFGLNSKETAKGFHQLGLCYDWIGNYKAADSLYVQGIKIYEKLSDVPPKGMADILNDFGTFVSNLGNQDSAVVIYKKSLDIYGIYNKEKGKKEAITINNIAVSLHKQNKTAEAEKYYLEALELLTNLYGINRPEIGSIYNNLAFIYLDYDNFKAAEEAFEKAYSIKLSTLGDKHPSIGLAMINLGMLYFTSIEYKKAEISLLKSIDFFISNKATKNPFLSLAYYWLGRTYLESNRLIDSENMLRKSISLREEIYTKSHSKIWSSVGELAICLLKQKRYKEAEKLLAESLNFYKNDKNRDIKIISRYTEYSAILYREIGNKSLANFYQTEFEKLKNEPITLR
ncbi:MAG: tetratricopeptide repeat protein [Ignavibacterium sp.]|nr:tetratricopeptide repeat protein [Ignavibacterium sp.]